MLIYYRGLILYKIDIMSNHTFREFGVGYKHDYDKILTRLTLILSRLNDGEALSVKALAEEFNVSTKTLQRDFNQTLETVK